MKDFFKIFFILCALVVSFVYGRKYGEDNFKQGEEYQSLIKIKNDQSYLKNEFENTKIKFQNIIDTSESKKSEELLAQILQVFLIDLGLRIQNQKTFIKEPSAENEILKKTITSSPPLEEKQIEKTKPKEKTINQHKFKSYEWMLQNSRDDNELRKNLKNIEIKSLPLFLEMAYRPKINQLEYLFGSYRGRLFSVDGTEFSTLIFEIKPYRDRSKEKIHLRIVEIRQGKTTEQTSDTNQVGFISNMTNSFLLNLKDSNKFYQIYKINDTNQLTGFLYEQLINGTTNTIGSFILNRVDQF